MRTNYPYDVSATEGYHPTWNDGLLPYTSPTGSFQANGYGLFDMTGNVSEWCNDWQSHTYYASRPDPDVSPTGPTSGDQRCLRGGSWAGNARSCRVASRDGLGPDHCFLVIGFRIVLDS